MVGIRRLIVTAALMLSGIGAAHAQNCAGVYPTQAQAQANCTAFKGDRTDRFIVASQCTNAGGGGALVPSCRVQTQNGGHLVSYGWSQAEPECEAGADSQFASVDGSSDEICHNGCAYKCDGAVPGFGCATATINGATLTVGDWAQTGETCGGDDEPPEPPECMALGNSGFQFCEADPPGCVRSPAGAMLCPDIPGPDCATAPSGAACSNQPPPEGYGPGENFTICPSGGQCSQIIVAPPEDEDDDEEEDDDCPPDDPNCEDDEDDEEPEDPPAICTEDNQTVCDLLREIRTATRGTEKNTEAQLEEDRETNAKLKAIKDQLKEDSKRTVDAIDRVQVATDSVRTATNNAATSTKSAVQAAASSVTSAVQSSSTAVTTSVNTARESANANTATLASKLDGIATKIAEQGPNQSGPIGVTVDNSGVESAIDGQTGTLGGKLDGIGDGVDGLGEKLDGIGESLDGIGDCIGAEANCVGNEDPGEGGTAEDEAAAGVKEISIGLGDLDGDGFGLGNACPVFPPLSIGGMPFEFDNTFWCQFLDIVRAVMLLLGAWWAVRILMGD